MQNIWEYRRIHDNTGDQNALEYRGYVIVQGFRVDKGIHERTEEGTYIYRAIYGSTGGYMGLQGDTWEFRGIHGNK